MVDISKRYQQSHIVPENKPVVGFDAFIKRVIGVLISLYPFQFFFLREAKKIVKLSASYELLNDAQFKSKILECKENFKLDRVKKDKKLLHNAMAIVCEASYRSLGIRPYEVQVLGALSMYRNFIIQMYTGEGKTLTAGLTAVLYGWSGNPCHVVTSNDYLAKRDSQELSTLYSLCEVSVGFIESEMNNDERKGIYKKNIVYATSNNILADFLRDQMVNDNAYNFNGLLLQHLKQEKNQEQVLQGLHTIIVDEADSLLADEAIVPLIISIPKENRPLKNTISAAKELSRILEEGKHYKVNKKYEEVVLTEDGEVYIEELSHSLDALWKSKKRREYLVTQAIVAKVFYLNGTHYVIQDDKLVIVDEKTGRLMPDRSWGNGLHQAIEAKEGIELSDPTETHIKMSFQRFFRLYKNICGMSGTLQGLSRELWHIYDLLVLKIPKRIPNNYLKYKEKIVRSQSEKWQVVVEEVLKIHQTKQPILIGTRSIKDSEKLSEKLKKHSISHQVLNALYHDSEAEIIAKAGELGMVTIATNMAGRGTDIKVPEESIDVGGLHVIATERHTSERIDKQLFGRTARKGQPGSVQQIVSLEDELFSKNAPKWLQKKRESKVSVWVQIWFYKYIQKKSDSGGSKKRISFLEQEFSVKNMLSFSSKV
jgi:preprotein translocase subunit SecA